MPYNHYSFTNIVFEINSSNIFLDLSGILLFELPIHLLFKCHLSWLLANEK